eukprot:Colp12_sorted_trinity150504_noHs@5348
MLRALKLQPASILRVGVNSSGQLNRHAQKVRLICDFELFKRADSFGQRVAVVDDKGKHTYSKLVDKSARLSNLLVETKKRKEGTKADDLLEDRVAFLCGHDFAYAVTQFAIWRAGGICVPLSPSSKASEISYFLEDAQASTIVVAPQYQSIVEPVAKQMNVDVISLDIDYSGKLVTEAKMVKDRRVTGTKCTNAMMIYTSGTTGKPKGVLTSHKNIQAQIETLVTAWKWTQEDRILHVLPLHHVHGVVNVLLCALWSGAICEFLPKFDASATWKAFLRDSADPKKLSLFMAVPTVYAKLIEHHDSKLTAEERAVAKERCSNLRLMVSGSAALPEPIMHRWEEISGHRLLERYGMTEIGMGLSNPYDGPRVPGSVGKPLPGVEARIVDLATGAPVPVGSEGELQIKGPSVFQEYWGRPEATKEIFTDDGWFKTGDTSAVVDGVYRILGRTSVDILKVGGYKLSALDIERELLSHPGIAEAAVIGVPDDVYGQRIVALVTPREGVKVTVEDLSTFSKGRMASYKNPKEYLISNIPRNAMGKVNKKDLIKKYVAKEL